MSSPRPYANDHGPPIPGIIGASPAMEAVYRITRRVAKTNASVLLMGDTGTGKELIATAIHKLSTRNSGPFVKVNCGALTETFRSGHVTFGSGFSMCSSTAIGSFPLGTLAVKRFLNQLMMLLSVTGRF